MSVIRTYFPAGVLMAGLLSAGAVLAQDTATNATTNVVPTPTGPTREIAAPPPEGSAAHQAQLQREHNRAVAAGDHANDPFNSSSSDSLNQQQLAKAVALGNDPVVVTEDGAQPVPRPNIQESNSDTTGTLPADPDPSLLPPTTPDASPPGTDDSLKTEPIL